MRLTPIPLDITPAPLPDRVRSLLDDADERIERFYHDRRNNPVPAFVPCDFVLAYHALQEITAKNLSAGGKLVEWGSGVGIVACLASLAGFDAIGIEIEDDLVDIAQSLADDHSIDVEFVRGSFVPDGGDDWLDDHAHDLAREVTWLRSDGEDAYELLGLDPDDFDVVFAYPWPGEEGVVFDLFAEYAGIGSLLLTHHGLEGMRLQRKTR